jgi:hypothetical protein
MSAVARSFTEDELEDMFSVGEATVHNGRIVPLEDVPLGHVANPVEVPDDVLDRATRQAVRDWMLAQMREGRAVEDPIFRYVVCPDGEALDGGACDASYERWREVLRGER